MLKLSFLVKRKEGVTHEQLLAHWRDVHAPGVVEHIRPDHYRITFFDQGDGAPFDGMASIWFEDAERGRHVTGDGVPEAVRNDGFGELAQRPFVGLECEEHVIVDGPRPEDALKITAFLKPKAGTSVDELYKCWLEEHAPNVGAAVEATDGGLRYVISLATQGADEPAYAGYAELWYRDEAARQAQKTAPDGFRDFIGSIDMLTGKEIAPVP